MLDFLGLLGLRDFSVKSGDFEIFLDGTSGTSFPMEVRAEQGVKVTTEKTVIYGPPGGVVTITALERAVSVSVDYPKEEQLDAEG